MEKAMPHADARRHAETRRRFEDVECKLSEVHCEVFTLWGMIEQQRRKIEALQKRVGGIARSARRRQGSGSRRR